MRPRWFFISFATILFCLVTALTWRQLNQQGQPNVILLTVESLRQDMVSPQNTPHLIAFARHANTFTHHRAISAWTGTNIVSLLTGLAPFHHGVHTRGQSVDADAKLFLEQLAERGYQIQGIQPFMAMDIYKNTGLTVIPAAPDVLLQLAELKLTEKPFFLWYHYLHTHLPYAGAPPDTTNSKKAERLAMVRKMAEIRADEVHFERGDQPAIQEMQNTNVREFDRWFGALYDFFLAGGFSRDTILIVTSDHGDEHGERGMVGHASTTLAGHLHEEVINLPLAIYLPKYLRHKAVECNHDRLSSHPDIMATLAALLDLQPQTQLDGISLFAAGQKDWWTGMTSSGGFNEPDPENIRYFEYASLHWPWKLRLRRNQNGAQEIHLYNLREDPLELSDLAKAHPEITRQHLEILDPLIRSRRMIAKKARTNPASDIPAPTWIRPEQSGSFTYDTLAGSFVLQWHGDTKRNYTLQYRAGKGKNTVQGELEVSGNLKNFGWIDRRYWNTWLVPRSPFLLRVRDSDSDSWSPWLVLEAKP
jgi:choline-sulfatase